MAAQLVELEKKRDELVETKDAEIRDLKERIEEMSNDFSSILRDTLQKLNESVMT
jgi:DNA replication initiation complex subunit (GINS family)